MTLPLVAGFFIFYVLHVAVWRAKPSNEPRIFLLAVLAAVGLGASLILVWLMKGTDVPALFVTGSAGALVYMVYAYFYSGICRSVSLTLAADLAAAPGTSRPLSAITEAYVGSSRFEDRLAVMHKAGALRLKGDQVELTEKGVQGAKTIRLISILICGGLEG